jgi:hypothetical protein
MTTSKTLDQASLYSGGGYLICRRWHLHPFDVKCSHATRLVQARFLRDKRPVYHDDSRGPRACRWKRTALVAARASLKSVADCEPHHTFFVFNPLPEHSEFEMPSPRILRRSTLRRIPPRLAEGRRETKARRQSGYPRRGDSQGTVRMPWTRRRLASETVLAE